MFRYYFIGAITFVSASVVAQELYGSGYTIISPMETSDDIKVTIVKRLNSNSASLETALAELIEGTGWRLASTFAADPLIRRLYNQPLPKHKEKIGPMPLDEALVWLAGDAWQLVLDPVNRLISYEVKQHYRREVPIIKIKRTSAPELKVKPLTTILPNEKGQESSTTKTNYSFEGFGDA